MNKQKIIEMMDNHKALFRVAFAMVNRIPFNNSWGGKPDIGLSLLKGCKIVNRGANNRIVIGDYSRLINCTITISGSNNTIYMIIVAYVTMRIFGLKTMAIRYDLENIPLYAEQYNLRRLKGQKSK